MDNRYNESKSPYKTIKPAYLRILLSLCLSPFQQLKPLLFSLEPTHVYKAYTMHSLLISYPYKFYPYRFACLLEVLIGTAPNYYQQVTKGNHEVPEMHGIPVMLLL